MTDYPTIPYQTVCDILGYHPPVYDNEHTLSVNKPTDDIIVIRKQRNDGEESQEAYFVFYYCNSKSSVDELLTLFSDDFDYTSHRFLNSTELQEFFYWETQKDDIPF